MTEDTRPVTLERGRPVTDTELLRRADWIRLRAVELIAQAGLGHYGFSGSGPTSQAMNIEPLASRFAAFGWLVREIDGHDVATLRQTLDTLPDTNSKQPVCVIAHTRKGHGVEMFEKQPQAWHLGLLNPEQQADVVAEITARMQLAEGSTT